MQLTQTLLGYLNRVFNEDPAPFLALRLNYDGQMTWQVQDGVLTTFVVGGSGGAVSVDLSQYTVLGLANHLTALQGYDVPYVDGTALNVLSALVIMDGSGDQAQSNGDHLFGYTSLLWAYLEAAATELTLAEKQIEQLPAEMSTTTADGYWLDFIGDFYGVPRGFVTAGGVQSPEPDTQYGPRIIQTVLAPRGNNVAIEIAIKNITGQDTTVTDAPIAGPGFPLYDGAIHHDGTWHYNSSATRLYGLFDVAVGFDFLGGQDPAGFITDVTGMLDAFRDAGTHLRQIKLSGGTLSDTYPTGTIADSMAIMAASLALTDTVPAQSDAMGTISASLALTDTATVPTESDTFQISYSTTFNGLRNFDGSVPAASGTTVTESY